MLQYLIDVFILIYNHDVIFNLVDLTSCLILTNYKSIHIWQNLRFTFLRSSLELILFIIIKFICMILFWYFIFSESLSRKYHL